MLVRVRQRRLVRGLADPKVLQLAHAASKAVTDLAQRVSLGHTPFDSRVSWTGDRWLVSTGGFWVYTSSDGIDWRVAEIPWQDRVYFSASAGNGANLLVAGRRLVPELEYFQFVSDNGEYWEQRPAEEALPLLDLCWTGDEFVGVGADGLVATSLDGHDWSTQTVPLGTTLWSVDSGGGSVVVVHCG